MPAERGFALLRTADQWKRSTYEGAALDEAAGVVSLAWTAAPLPPGSPSDKLSLGGGLAFDAQCRLYHSVPDEGRVERALWHAQDPLAPLESQPAPADLFAAVPEPAFGDFHGGAPSTPPFGNPGGLAIDEDDRLFVADSGARRVFVFDLWSSRLLNRVDLDGAAPLDLALDTDELTVWAVAEDPPALVRFGARSDPAPVDLPEIAPGDVPVGATPQRITISPAGEVFLLYRDPAGDGWVVPYEQPAHVLPVAGATDIAFDADGYVVVACGPGQPFVRALFTADEWSTGAQLIGRDYDGLGIVATPDGRIGFWTNAGRFREAVPARLVYASTGRVSTYRLDAGSFQMVWGRLFLDACVPVGTAIRAAFATTDEDDADVEAVPWSRPVNLEPGPRPAGSPPLCPVALAPGDGPLPATLHQRETGRELPWARHAQDDPFETYEAPIAAAPGRYLWVTLELAGDTRSTPRVRCMRAEHPSHDYVSRLPRTYSRDPAAASFLLRYLAIFDGVLGDLDARSADRQALLDPYAAPQEILSWLAGFLGLVLDERWPVPVRRQLIAEAACLFRFRGTVRGLEKFLEIVIGSEARVLIIEHYRLRGLGGALLSDEPSSLFAGAVVGMNYRVGGEVGEEGDSPLTGTPADAITAHAHRFSVVIPAVLDDVQLAVVDHVLDVHRPAHTIYEVCTVGAGMRVGLGLHVGLLSMIGRTGGFTTMQLGASALGRGAIVGRPELGARPGGSRIGTDMRVG